MFCNNLEYTYLVWKQFTNEDIAYRLNKIFVQEFDDCFSALGFTLRGQKL